jgi:serine protease
MAGVVALMKSGNPDGVTPDTLDVWLQSGDITEDLGTAGRDDIYGHGLINAALAVQAAASGTVPTLVTASPDTLDFGTVITELTLTLGKTGDGSISNTVVTENATWLEITSTPGTADGLGDYTLTADRNGLGDGIYKTEIDVTYTADGDARSLSIPVTLTKGSGTTGSGDTGFTWVIVVDANNFTSVAGTALAGENGVYNYSIPNVPNGDYYVIAGTDSDNDNILCDAGEACGGYPTLGILQRVTVNGANVSNIDFDLNFPTELGLGALIAGMDSGQGFTRPVMQVLKEVRP